MCVNSLLLHEPDLYTLDIHTQSVIRLSVPAGLPIRAPVLLLLFVFLFLLHHLVELLLALLQQGIEHDVVIHVVTCRHLVLPVWGGGASVHSQITSLKV